LHSLFKSFPDFPFAPDSFSVSPMFSAGGQMLIHKPVPLFLVRSPAGVATARAANRQNCVPVSPVKMLPVVATLLPEMLPL
jgi:hypothetical protein